jgi:hypothetical protein
VLLLPFLLLPWSLRLWRLPSSPLPLRFRLLLPPLR